MLSQVILKRHHEVFLIPSNSVDLLPIPEVCNEDVRYESDECFMHLFYIDPRKELKVENVKYKCSFRSPWSQLSSAIESKLRLFELGTYGISVGLIDQDITFPELKPFKKTFESHETGKRIMVAIASSFKECRIRISCFNDFY